MRYLRLAGYLKALPKSATVGDLVKTQGEIIRKQVIKTTEEYRKHYRTHVRRKYLAHVAGKKQTPPRPPAVAVKPGSSSSTAATTNNNGNNKGASATAAAAGVTPMSSNKQAAPKV